MPLLIALGVIVLVAAVAIFNVNKLQAGRYAKLAQKAKVADDADDLDDFDEEEISNKNE